MFGANAAHPSERLSVAAFKRLDRIAQRTRRTLEANHKIFNDFLATRDDLSAAKIEVGTVAFPRLNKGSVDELCALLREKYQTTVVPGKFFESPQHFRVFLGGDAETTRGGLERLGAALDELGT